MEEWYPLCQAAIFRDNLLRYSKPTDDVVLYDPSHMLGFQYGVGGCLYPLG